MIVKVYSLIKEGWFHLKKLVNFLNLSEKIKA